MVATIVFANPALWLGLLALGLPLAIHLLTRRTPKKIVFPTLLFLRRAMAHKSSLYRLRHWLLLLLRTALVLLVLLVFLKPAWTQSQGAAAQDPDAPRTQIILLDASASMGFSDGGVTPFTEAKVAVDKILAKHRPGDHVNLIRMAGTPRASLDEPSDSIFFLRKDLEAMTLSEEFAQVNLALAEALRQIEGVELERGGGRKQIFLVSDFQRSNWSALDFKSVGAGIELFFVPAVAETHANCAVTDVTVRPSRPTRGEAVEIVCKVANYGDRPRSLPLELTFGEGDTFRKVLEVGPLATVSASFDMRFHEPGQWEGRLTLPEDGLTIDNTRYLVLTVAEKLNIQLVSDASVRDAASGLRFLERAINPFLRTQRATAIASVMASGALRAGSLSRAQVVVLSELNELSEGGAEVLVSYLRAGGSVIYFHAGGSEGHNLRVLTEVADGDLALPYKLTGQVELASRERFVTLAQANFDYGALARFRESSDLADLRFFRFFSTDRIENRGQVLMRYDDDNIAMAQTTVGPGTLLLCNFGCGLIQSDLAKHTLFVPLVHEMIKHLRPGAGIRDAFVVGDACFMTLADVTHANELRFQDPGGEALEGSADVGPQGAACFFPRAQRCGFHRVLVDDAVAGTLAVNVDPRESPLEALDVSQLTELARVSQAQTVALDGHSAGLERALAGTPLWPTLLLMAVGLLCLEQGVVLLCR